MHALRASVDATGDQPRAFHFLTVDGTRLRYLDHGKGTPVVMLHGNGSMIEDFVSSGIMDHAPGHRFIVLDRPGFGYSERPPGRLWGPFEQANLLRRALLDLEVERPIIVGHSWGTLVALAMALENAEEVSGLVLMSGFYYPIGPRQTVRIPAAVFSHMRRLMAPETMRRVFAPCRIPERFIKIYPMSRAMGLSQMLAVDDEAAMLLPAVRALSQRYRELSLPVCLIAGSEDRIVDTDRQSVRLQEELSNATFYRVPECGHMVHHIVPELVVAAIVAIGVARSEERAARPPMVVTTPQRHWLHIGESPVAA
jgi:pimeloyl-ACP methyl ester carboxylesterase